MRAAVGSAALVATAEGGCRRPRRRDEFGNGEPGSKDFGRQRGDVLCVDQRMVDGWNGILPEQSLFGNERTEIARERTHVAMGELEPCARECVGKLVGMREEAA